jgi:hypothetical protein
MSRLFARLFAGLGVAAVIALGGCGGIETSPDSYRNPRVDPDAQVAERGSIFGGAGLDFLSGSKKPDQGAGGGGIGVNSFLWRASLDTLAFMPLASADPFGGVIITDWYSPPESPDERFKVNIFILDRQLRSDGVRAAVFHQHHDAGGAWTDASIEATTQTDLENTILTRARQLRINTAAK